MKILLVNPNTTVALTDRLARVARAAALPQTELVPLTAPRGVPYVATRAEAQIAGALVLEMIAEHPDADAAVIGAFGDPGLVAARELFPFPVVGMAEAAMVTARFLGERFAILAIAKRFTRWYADGVALQSMGAVCVGILAPDATFTSVEEAENDIRDGLIATARSAVDELGADVVVPAGAPLAGIARDIEAALSVPVVDPITAAVLQAEALVRLGARRPSAACAAHNGAKVTTGIAAGLAAALSADPNA